MQLIAGLGNPGEKYRDNPHNIGFRTLDQLMDALNLEGFLKNVLINPLREYGR